MAIRPEAAVLALLGFVAACNPQGNGGGGGAGGGGTGGSGGSKNVSLAGTRVALDAGGNIVVVQRLTPGLAKFDAQGVQLWSHSFPSAPSAYVEQVSIDAQGRIAITGTVSGNANFGTGPLAALGTSDVFVAAFAP